MLTVKLGNHREDPGGIGHLWWDPGHVLGPGEAWWSSEPCAPFLVLRQWSCLSLGASACVLEVDVVLLRQFLSKEPWGPLDLGIELAQGPTPA